jgi:hypothetical protein
MSLAPQLHPGLPVVPRPSAGELLGSWLLRIAQVYGLDLHDLLVRLAAVPPASRGSPPWYELHRDHLHTVHLAAALHCCVESIAAMAAPRCDRRWPAELGFCAQCLDEATSAGAPYRWLQRWMHPLALACEKHHSWLQPVTTRRLREIRAIPDIARLPRKTPLWSALEWRRESLLIDSALWLEALVINPVEHHPPWGKTDADDLAKILRTLIHVLMSPAAADMARHQLGRSPTDLPERRQRWACQIFRVDDGVNAPMLLPAPDHLRHRQFVMGLLGYYLRLAPTKRAPLQALAKLIGREIPAWQLARWPPAAAKWVSPFSAMNPPPDPRRRTSTRQSRSGHSAPAPLFGV